MKETIIKQVIVELCQEYLLEFDEFWDIIEESDDDLVGIRSFEKGKIVLYFLKDKGRVEFFLPHQLKGDPST